MKFLFAYSHLYTRLIITFSVAFCLLQLSYAQQWPTEPYQGITLCQDVDTSYFAMGAAEASDGSIRLLVKMDAEPGWPDVYQTGIVAWNRDGTPHWDLTNPFEHKIHARPNEWNSAVYTMAIGPNDETWVVYQNFYNTPEDDFGVHYESYLSAGRVDADGVAWDFDLDVSEYENGGDRFKYPVHIEPQEDGGLIVLWPEGNPYIGGIEEFRAQRISAEGDLLWGSDGIQVAQISRATGRELDYNLSTIDSEGVSDGEGGFYFGIEESVIHMRPDGSLTWGLGDVVDDTIVNIRHMAWNDYEDTISLYGWGGNGRAIGSVDTNGVFLHGPGVSFPDPWLQFPKLFSANAAGHRIIELDTADPRILRFDLDLNLIADTPYEWSDVFGTRPIYWSFNRHGVRISQANHGDEIPQILENTKVRAYDLDMNQQWVLQVSQDTTVYRMRLTTYLDCSGTTWLFWSDTGPGIGDDQQAILKGNVVDLYGNLGTLDVDEFTTRYTLPTAFELTSIYPNPFNSNTSLMIEAARPVNLTLTVHNLLGQVVYQDQLTVSAGSHTVPLVLDGLSSGSYWMQMQSKNMVSVYRRAILLK